MKNIYQEKGYKDREDYLRQLADEFNISYGILKPIADVLGPTEDFDGLVSSLEDYGSMLEDEPNEYFDDIDFGW